MLSVPYRQCLPIIANAEKRFLYVSLSSALGLARLGSSRLVSTRLVSFRFLFRLDLWLVDDSCAMTEITTTAVGAGNGAGVGSRLC